MNAPVDACREARLLIGADPGARLSPELEAHVAGCAACSRFREETRGLDARLRVALELPLHTLRRKASPVRRFALAASVALAIFAGGALWTLRPATALAGEIVGHVIDEPSSWQSQAVLPASYVAELLAGSGVQYDIKLPVIYATRCPFEGQLVPHLVLQTADGPVTVLLLARQTVHRRTEFKSSGLRGVILPARHGSIAVLAQGERDPMAVATQVVSWAR
jgi:hypothetical protein